MRDYYLRGLLCERLLITRVVWRKMMMTMMMSYDAATPTRKVAIGILRERERETEDNEKRRSAAYWKRAGQRDCYLGFKEKKKVHMIIKILDFKRGDRF